MPKSKQKLDWKTRFVVFRFKFGIYGSWITYYRRQTHVINLFFFTCRTTSFSFSTIIILLFLTEIVLFIEVCRWCQKSSNSVLQSPIYFLWAVLLHDELLRMLLQFKHVWNAQFSRNKQHNMLRRLLSRALHVLLCEILHFFLSFTGLPKKSDHMIL